MGRLLVKWVKNAGYDDTCRDDEALWAYAHSTNFTPPLAMRFLSGIGISRIELDNLPHGYDFQTSGKVHFSVYYPYVIMHYTKKCSIIFGGKKYPDPGAECPRPCSANVLKADLYGNTAYLGGSVIYFVNDVLPKILDHFVQMDRVVFLDKWPV